MPVSKHPDESKTRTHRLSKLPDDWDPWYYGKAKVVISFRNGTLPQLLLEGSVLLRVVDTIANYRECIYLTWLKPRLHLPRSSCDFSVCDFLYDF